MALQRQLVGVTADLTIRVPRDAGGSMEDGARAVLERTAAVDEVDALEVTGVEPRLNDLTVTATATLTVEPPPDEDLAEALAGFGVTVQGAIVED